MYIYKQNPREAVCELIQWVPVGGKKIDGPSARLGKGGGEEKISNR